MSYESGLSVRPSTLGDYDGISAVMERNGLASGDAQEWRRRWAENPFRLTDADLCTGWVLEAPGGRIVGSFGSIPLEYTWNQRRIVARAASALAVDLEFRQDSVALFAKFFRQKGVVLLLNTSANYAAGRVFEGFKARRVPHPAFDEVLFWITEPLGFSESVLRKKRIPMAQALKYPASLAARVMGASARLTRGMPARACVRRQDWFDPRFDVFWEDLRQRPDLLLAVRSRAALEWHFGVDRIRKRPEVFVLEEGERLLGYCVLVYGESKDTGLRRYTVADLQVLRDDPQHVRALVSSAVAFARERGVHVLEVIGLSRFKRAALAELRPCRRRLPSWCFYYKVLDPSLASELGKESAWDPGPFDGDLTL